MTKQNRPSPDRSFVGSKLPWLIAVAALLVYVLTLNHWVSLNNLALVARTSGWMWGPELYTPVFYAFTFPLRWLSAAWIPLGFNLFSAVCGALALGLLARSVVLLPHDRTHDQRLREKSGNALFSGHLAWLPPLLAVLICGLQLTVWENSTTGSSDIFDLLLIAYILRCVLEYRLDERDSWMFRAALVCGAAMANNWIMVVLFPAFLVSLIWIKRLEFFNARFLLRLLLCGLAGTLFYLLLPTIHVLSGDPLMSFWAALKTNLAADKQAVLFFTSRAQLNVLVLLAVTSILPLLVIGVRWASNFGDPSKTGSAITTVIFHVAHAALLLVLIWVAFDPVFSPRRKGFSLSIFPYLSALSIGYLAGYFLLVFNTLPDRFGRTTTLQRALNKFSLIAIAVLLVVAPVGLLSRNLPQIRLTTSSALEDYTAQLIQSLPSKGVVLSDDSRKLVLAQAMLTRKGRAGDYLFLDTGMLTIPGYHSFQKARHPAKWPAGMEPQRKDGVGPNLLINLLLKFSDTNPIAYLHPSFGYYFEVFEQRPRGLSMELVRYPTNSISGPPLSESELAANEKFWADNQAAIERFAPFIAPPALTTNVTFAQVLNGRLSIPFQPNATAITLGSFYSQGLNNWGVQLQRASRLEAAQHRFRLAIELFPENLAAKNNLVFNRELRAGHSVEVRPTGPLEDELGRFRSWEHALRETGPFDDPTHCFSVGLAFAQGNLYRQAAQQLERVHAAAPDKVSPMFWLSRLYVMNQQPDKALVLINQIKNQLEDLAALGIRKIDLLQAEAGALYMSGKKVEADELLKNTVRQNLKDPQTLATVMQVSSVFKNYTNALFAVSQLLQIRPNDVPALLAMGVLSVQSGMPADAIDPLTRVISLQSTNYGAKLYRAIAYLNSEQVIEAQQDYESLQKSFPNSNEVNSGLAEVAWRRKDTNAAVRYYELCLKNVPLDSPQARFLADRINSLKSPAP
ncbi:MAG: DUF2723 domain-containing protein [Akkermansiaceae bacterium]|nr:DUF2723 domain-containing protein [Verrucomicrobiales bacterium]